jgi:hypothetical protein
MCDSGATEGAQRVSESGLPEVEDVVVGQHADVGSDGGQARDVVWVHPVVHCLAGRESAIGCDGGFQVE